jgi:hypothetical protein
MILCKILDFDPQLTQWFSSNWGSIDYLDRT